MATNEELVEQINLDGETVKVKPPTPREQFTKRVGLLRQAEPFLAEATREMNKVEYSVAYRYGISQSDLAYATQQIASMTILVSELLDKEPAHE